MARLEAPAPLSRFEGSTWGMEEWVPTEDDKDVGANRGFTSDILAILVVGVLETPGAGLVASEEAILWWFNSILLLFNESGSSLSSHGSQGHDPVFATTCSIRLKSFGNGPSTRSPGRVEAVDVSPFPSSNCSFDTCRGFCWSSRCVGSVPIVGSADLLVADAVPLRLFQFILSPDEASASTLLFVFISTSSSLLLMVLVAALSFSVTSTLLLVVVVLSSPGCWPSVDPNRDGEATPADSPSCTEEDEWSFEGDEATFDGDDIAVDDILDKRRGKPDVPPEFETK
jgi:hypothetical protein